ncbi:MAG: nickel-dependent lactate racemase [Dehalococcoidia bacterium]|nr:nickel-dependent lactate racemase [Dehalococcoidia bacterium]
MRVPLPYGEGTLDATLPDDALVLTPARTPPLAGADAAVRAAILTPLGSPPLARLAGAGQRVCIVVSDVTRPLPNAVILPPVLDALAAAGVRRDDITLLIGTGLHRPSRPDERLRILGPEILARYRVVDHDARDASAHRRLMTAADGTEIALNAVYLDAHLRIVTGFVEPHLFAGYSGGGKGVMPGVAGAAAILANHGARMIGHPKATWCATDGNPIFEQMRDVALKSDVGFCLNVTLDERQRITGVFAGDLVQAHDAAIAQAARQSLRPIPRLYDVVVVTNMGYPADLVLYQSVKGMSVAAQAVAPGGAILLVAECREGVGGAEYAALLHAEASPHALLARLGQSPAALDQWQVQVQAMVQARCDVWVRSSLPRGGIEAAHLRFAPDVDRTLKEIMEMQRAALGRPPSVCALPYGQLTVPRLSGAS